MVCRQARCQPREAPGRPCGRGKNDDLPPHPAEPSGIVRTGDQRLADRRERVREIVLGHPDPVGAADHHVVFVAELLDVVDADRVEAREQGGRPLLEHRVPALVGQGDGDLGDGDERPDQVELVAG